MTTLQPVHQPGSIPQLNEPFQRIAQAETEGGRKTVGLPFHTEPPAADAELREHRLQVQLRPGIGRVLPDADVFEDRSELGLAQVRRAGQQRHPPVGPEPEALEKAETERVVAGEIEHALLLEDQQTVEAGRSRRFGRGALTPGELFLAEMDGHAASLAFLTALAHHGMKRRPSDKTATQGSMGTMASERAEVVATRHMVVAGHQLATSAAFSVLEAGGNAIDAGVAGGLALGILESDLVSVAGVAPIMVYSAEAQQVVTISGLGWWPKAADIEHFRREYGGAIPNGVLRTVVPAAPDAWITALELWGRMSFGEVAQAAIRYARDGFPMYPLMERIVSEHEAEFRAAPDTAAIFLPGGRPPRTGELFFQKEGAAALQYMADEEAAAARRGGRKAGLAAARDAFYKGDIARRIAEWQAAEGGWMTREDLASFPGRHRGARARTVRQCGGLCLRALVPGAGADRGAEHSRRL